MKEINTFGEKVQSLMDEDKIKQDNYRQMLIEKTIKPDLFLILQDNWHREFRSKMKDILMILKEDKPTENIR